MERGESLREPGMPGMKGSGLVRSLPSVCVQGECVRPRSVGGVDTVVSSLEIFGLCGHLGLSELLRDNGEDYHHSLDDAGREGLLPAPGSSLGSVALWRLPCGS